MNQLQRPRSYRPTLQGDLQGLAPIKVESALLRQQIIAALRRAIELGTLKAGDRLVEKDLCARLNVSRTSLREALRDLEANGVVTNLSARRLVVTPVSREDAINMSRVRTAIEMLLAEQFIKHAGDRDVAELRAALKRLRAAVPSDIESLDAGRSYYQIWCNGARNAFAFNLVMNIQLRLSVIRSGGLKKREFRLKYIALQEAALDCMAKRDVAEAQQAIRRHNQSAIKEALGEAEKPVKPSPPGAPKARAGRAQQ